jgi:hypothetical protein
MERQRERLQKARQKKARAAKVRAAVKAPPPPKPVEAPKEQPKPARKPAPKKYKIKPMNGDKTWIKSPQQVVDLKKAGMMDLKMKDLRPIGYQYDVRDTSKEELVGEILKVARREVRKMK